jgi:hypothetical protein
MKVLRQKSFFSRIRLVTLHRAELPERSFFPSEAGGKILCGRSTHHRQEAAGLRMEARGAGLSGHSTSPFQNSPEQKNAGVSAGIFVVFNW